MTQEQKDLLLKDLCGRLPYFVKVQIKNEIVVLNSICDDDGYHFNFIGDDREGVNIEDIKPYLFPLSSMTEEQMNQFNETLIGTENLGWSNETFDWLNANHFDYRGLIPMGLAIDATGLNIY
jgi:hypothetical protein